MIQWAFRHYHRDLGICCQSKALQLKQTNHHLLKPMEKISSKQSKLASIQGSVSTTWNILYSERLKLPVEYQIALICNINFKTKFKQKNFLLFQYRSFKLHTKNLGKTNTEVPVVDTTEEMHSKDSSNTCDKNKDYNSRNDRDHSCTHKHSQFVHQC